MKGMAKKRSRKPLVFILSTLAILGIVAILAVILGPRLLVQQATQKPENTGTFVTRQLEVENTVEPDNTPDLNQRLQSAIANAPPTETTQNETSNLNGDSRNATETSTTENTIVEIPVNRPDPPVSGRDVTDSGVTNSDSVGSAPTVPETVNTAPTRSVPQNRASQTERPKTNVNDFNFQISQNEISSMIYNGLVGGTAPAYRQSIQGVSTTISGGRAKITVALLPKHLPDAFLNRLPGVNRGTPTVYLGGEMGLRVSGNTVEPQIHRVSLGNMGVPMPFIESAVRAQVQAYVRNAMRLPNGQKARLQQVTLEGGAVRLRGQLQ